VIVRLFSLLVVAWSLGFAAFMLLLAEPVENVRTDAIVVPTGGAGRIERGLALLERRQARRMLVTGVAPGVRKVDLASRYGRAALIGCCVDLGPEAVDTRSNAEETAAWVRAHGFRSVRLVTSDWHMARARMELGAELAPEVRIVRDGVPGAQRLGLLVNEYNKLLLRRVALWLGLGR
jgi:uncharacterized SAM-binding protein YcdF (DUF218 family)